MLEQMDCFVYDMHTGRLDDLQFAIKALTREPLDGEKTLIVVSSVLAWAKNAAKMVEDKPEPIDDENMEDGADIVANNMEPEMDVNDEGALSRINEEGELDGKTPQEDSEDVLKSDEEWEEEEFPEEEENKEDVIGDVDNPDKSHVSGAAASKSHKSNKSNVMDGSLVNRTEEGKEGIEGEENLVDEKSKKRRKKKKKVIEIKYKRIGYTEEEYLQREPIDVFRKIKEYEDYLLNLKHDNLNIYIVCAGIPYGNAETIFNYFFKSAWLQFPEELPYLNDGVNLIPTIHVKDLAKIVRQVIERKPEQRYIFAVDQTHDKTLKNLISSISRGIGTGKTKSIEYKRENLLSFSQQDFFIDPKKTAETKKMKLLITNNELNWQEFLNYDIMLAPSKFIEEDFEWYCKDGIPKNLKKLLKEFTLFRKLRPLKIVLNCSDSDMRKLFASKLAKFFNIPIVNLDKVMSLLDLSEDELDDEEKEMKKKYLFLKDRLENLNPDDKNERNELLMTYDEIQFEAFKYCLNENDSVNRGYVLEGFPLVMHDVGMLYYKKVEIKEDPADNMDMEMEEEYEEEEEEPIAMEELKDDSNPEFAESKSKLIDGEISNVEGNENMEAADGMDNEGFNLNTGGENENMEGMEGNENVDAMEGMEGAENMEVPKKRKKKVKIIPKKYKTVFDKALLPESVISVCFSKNISNLENDNNIDNSFWEVEKFYQDNGIEVFNLIYNDNIDELFELMRIYVERVSL
jgi:hypothetical protein